MKRQELNYFLTAWQDDEPARFAKPYEMGFITQKIRQKQALVDKELIKDYRKRKAEALRAK